MLNYLFGMVLLTQSKSLDWLGKFPHLGVVLPHATIEISWQCKMFWCDCDVLCAIYLLLRDGSPNIKLGWPQKGVSNC